MKKFLLSIIFSVILVLPALASAQSAGFYIKSFDFYGTLSKNKVLTVQETIDVEFLEERHGIYRALPVVFFATRFDGEEYRDMTYSEDYRSVSIPGHKYSAEYGNDLYTIKIGDENKTIIGPHTYTITYKCIMFDDRIDISDFFYYCPLGPFWETNIEQFNFRIDFEEPLPPGTEFLLYSGEYSSVGNDLNVECYYNESSIWGRATKIPENNGISVFCELPEGYFENAKKVTPFWMYFFGILCLASCLIALYFIVTTRHKSPVQTVEFYPPDNISAAEVGYIIDNEANDSDLMALYPEWAHKGYIEIKEDKNKVLSFVKLKDIPEDAPEYQKILFKKSFNRARNFTLKNVGVTYVSELEKAKNKLEDTFEDGRALYEHELLSSGLLFLSSLFFTLFLCFSSPISMFENFYLFLLVIPYYVLGKLLNKSFYTKYFKKTKPILKILGMFALCALIGFISYKVFEDTEFHVPHIVVYVLCGIYLLVCLFNRRIIKQTDYNVEVTGKLLGLKEFIKTAEMPRLKELMDDNPNYYYDIFPYAMVFDLAERWAYKFTNIQMEAPAWYKSYGPARVFSTMDFNRSFQTEVTKSISDAIASSRPSKSHSGGGGSHGGFSGGGGGGGGGGSW